MDGKWQLEDDRLVWAPGSRGRLSPHVLRIRIRFATFLLDMGAISAAFALGSWAAGLESGWYAILGVMLPIYAGTALNAGAYSVDSVCSSALGNTNALKSLLFTTGTMFLIAYFLQDEQFHSRRLLLVTVGMTAIFIVVVRQTFAAVIERFWSDNLLAEVMVLDRVVIGAPPNMVRVDAQQLGLRPDLRDPVMLDRFATLMRGVDRVVIACPPDARQQWAMLLKGADVLGEVLIDDIDAIGAIGLGKVNGRTTLTVSVGPLDLPQRAVKRAFDLALGVPALIALAPVLLLVAAAIKVDSRGPALFRQRRIGRANAFFFIYKFRSMYDDRADQDGAVSTRRGDSRITRVGSFIRRTSLDELPQLLNVLGGSMSLVGPRPHALGSLAGEDLFWEVDERYWHRHVLKPGITGLAQVRGFRGATHERDDLTNRLQADLEYASEWSLWRDVSILLSTFRVLAHRNSF